MHEHQYPSIAQVMDLMVKPWRDIFTFLETDLAQQTERIDFDINEYLLDRFSGIELQKILNAAKLKEEAFLVMGTLIADESDGEHVRLTARFYFRTHPVLCKTQQEGRTLNQNDVILPGFLFTRSNEGKFHISFADQDEGLCYGDGLPAYTYFSDAILNEVLPRIRQKLILPAEHIRRVLKDIPPDEAKDIFRLAVSLMKDLGFMTSKKDILAELNRWDEEEKGNEEGTEFCLHTIDPFYKENLTKIIEKNQPCYDLEQLPFTVQFMDVLYTGLS